jgi:hypothetical protein
MQEEIETIEPQAGSQRNFVASSATEAALLGQAGGGKSYGLLLDFLYDYQVPEHNGVLFRKTYRDLEDLIAKSMKIYPRLGGVFKEQKHMWEFPDYGSRLWLSFLDNEKDVYHWLGWEFSWIGWDEISQFSKMPYLFMMSRLRCANARINKRVRCTSNPDGPGVGWVWDRFHFALKEKEIGWYKTDDGRDVRVPDGQGVSRQWFFSRREENRKLMDADPNYDRNLDLMPTERLRRAYKYGELVIEDDPEQLIKTEWWEAAVNGKNAYKPGDKAFGLDYAELGHDKSVDVEGSGNQPYRVLEWDYMAHPAMAHVIANDIFGHNGKFQTRGGIDTVGTGAGVYTSLQAMGDVYAERTDPIRYKDPEFDKKYDQATIKLHFRNIQDQILWNLREGFEKGLIDLSLLVAPGPTYYASMDKMKEEVLAFWFKIQNGEVWICSSNDLRKSSRVNLSGVNVPTLGRSPDRAKALGIWWWVHDRKPGGVRNKFIPKTDFGFHVRKQQRKDPPRRVTGV